MWFCTCNQGIQQTAATRYLDYLDYLNYLVLLEYLECLECLEHLGFIYFNKVSANGSSRLVGPMRINNYLREALAVSSTVYYTHPIHIGQIGACASGRDWHHSVLHAQGGQHLSRSSLRFQAQWWIMVLKEIDGGMSTVLPWSGQAVNKKNGILASLYPLGHSK